MSPNVMQFSTLRLSTLAFNRGPMLLTPLALAQPHDYQQALTDQQKNAPVLAEMVKGPGVYAGFQTQATYLVPTAQLAYRANLPRTPDITFSSDGQSWRIAMTIQLIRPSGANAAAVPLLMSSYSVAIVSGDATPGYTFTTVTPLSPPDGATNVVALLKAEGTIDEALALTLLRDKPGAQITVTGSLSYQYSFTRSIPPPPIPHPPPAPWPVPHPGPGPHPLPQVLVPHGPIPHHVLEYQEAEPTAASFTPQLNLNAFDATGHTETVTQGITADQALATGISAHFDPTLGDFKPIFAVLMGTGSDGTTWSQQTGKGYTRPSTSSEAYYILPDSFRMALDANSGLPSMNILLVETPAATADASASYTIKVRVAIAPVIDGARMEQIRESLNSSQNLPYAQLAVGGYSSATFVPSALFASLPGFQSGVSADGTLGSIDAANGFEIVLTCSLEFFTLLTKLLCSADGLQGTVQFQIVTNHVDSTPPVDTMLPVNVPVALTFLGPAPMKLTPQTTPADASDTAPASLTLSVTNPLGVPLQVAGIFPTLIRTDSGLTTGSVALKPSTNTLSLAANETQTFTVAAPAGGPLPAYSSLAVDFGTFTPTFDPAVVLNHYEDLVQSAGINASVHFNCYLLLHPDQIPAAFTNLVGMQIEVQHADGPVLTVPLTRDRPASDVAIPYTFAELLTGVSLAQPSFQYRSKCVFTDRAADFSGWMQNTGSIVEIVPV